MKTSDWGYWAIDLPPWRMVGRQESCYKAGDYAVESRTSAINPAGVFLNTASSTPEARTYPTSRKAKS